MLAKLCDAPCDWDKFVEKVEFAINNTVCRSTGETPSKLLFGINQLGNVNDKIQLFLDDHSRYERDFDELRKAAAKTIVNS